MRDIKCRKCKEYMAPTKHNKRLGVCGDCELD
jgi:hypothetical protein